MRGGLIIAIIVAVLAALLFNAAAQSITQKLSRIGPAISEGKVGAAGGTITGGAGDRAGRRLLYATHTLVLALDHGRVH